MKFLNIIDEWPPIGDERRGRVLHQLQGTLILNKAFEYHTGKRKKIKYYPFCIGIHIPENIGFQRPAVAVGGMTAPGDGKMRLLKQIK